MNSGAFSWRMIRNGKWQPYRHHTHQVVNKTDDRRQRSKKGVMLTYKYRDESSSTLQILKCLERCWEISGSFWGFGTAVLSRLGYPQDPDSRGYVYMVYRFPTGKLNCQWLLQTHYSAGWLIYTIVQWSGQSYFMEEILHQFTGSLSH